jgi:hypothetical protein
MSSSTLDLTGEETPVTTLGHGTGALGPSDSSDSGSDVMGGPGMDEGLSDDQTREMPETIHTTSGRDLGDGDLDSDSDRAGTGERGGSGVDGSSPNDQRLTIRTTEIGDDDDGPVLVTPDLDLITSVEDEDLDEAEEARGLDETPIKDGAT